MKFLLKISFIVFIALPLISYGQSSRSAMRKQRQVEKRMEEKKKEEEKKYIEAVREHYKMQSPETRKMMKGTFSQSRRDAEHRRQFFLKRWYDNIFNKRQMKENKGTGRSSRPKS